MFAATRLERKIDRLERKLDLILEHLGIPSPDASLDYGEIDELLRQGKKIQAIKLYRELHTSAGLKEAKDAVEAREHGGY
ncbi:ribosomal protein L7/L12 [Nocardia sp. NBC_00565]|uniref:ribosomal protein L7/L12 n=1 Tax=Nocardia sp. NBC_00565 TaxID=2975993 RepID=UPI002E7FE0B1|nr:ribosomal protein L7/L12 [Nocardia sp. NBC_00565]WUC03090.1 ribosomal protein L7/L12 [Nocardia sp. NBC_00565]